MRQLGLLCIVIALFVLTWTVIVPMEHRDEAIRQEQLQEQNKTHPRKVTFKEVSKKSKDAFITTAAFMKQEKESLQGKMSVTLQRVERELARLRAEANRAKATDKGELNRRILDLQEARVNLLNLKAGMQEPSESTWKTLKSNWHRLELDINARMQSDVHSG